MGYRIEYDGPPGAYPAKPRRSRAAALSAGAFLAFCLLTSLLLPEKWAAARSRLIPGDPEVTGAAFSLMTQELRCGEPLGAAVESFCARIIHGAVPVS